MKINRKYYPIVYVLCIIMIIVFSAIHAYNPNREGFNVNISGLNKNKITRKIDNFKKDIKNVGNEGFRAIERLFR